MTILAQLLGYTEADLEVAAILEPPPPSGSVDDAHEDWFSELEGRAAALQYAAHEHVNNDGADPLLDRLEMLRRQRNEIEQQMILLVAYMREKIRPRPYTLQQIADAAGLSVSGTRTFYDPDDVQALDERIGYAKQVVADEHARAGTTPGEPSVVLDKDRTPPASLSDNGTLKRVALHSANPSDDIDGQGDDA